MGRRVGWKRQTVALAGGGDTVVALSLTFSVGIVASTADTQQSVALAASRWEQRTNARRKVTVLLLDQNTAQRSSSAAV